MAGLMSTVREQITLKKYERRKRKEKKEGQCSHFTCFIHFQRQGEVVLPNVFLTREAGVEEATPP
jgi:hypothetical protein